MPQLNNGFCGSALQILAENITMFFYMSPFSYFFEILDCF